MFTNKDMKDTRPECKYGSLCYQKNELHLKKYKHPPKRKHGVCSAAQSIVEVQTTEPSCGNNSPKRQKESSPKRKKEASPQRKKEASPQRQKESSPNSQKERQNEASPQRQKEASPNSQKEDSPNKHKSRENESTGNVFKREVSKATREFIKKMFLVEMPRDFYSFWDFCASLCPGKPEDALKDCGLVLVGPFDVLSGKLKDSDISDATEHLTHWRYYYDPPEFQTVLRGDDKKKFHMGYFRDEPDASPCFVASNSAAVNCVITPVAENLFGAVNSYLESSRRVCDPFRKMKLKKLQDSLHSWVKGKGFNLDTSTAKMKAREHKVMARTFHCAGIVVPYDKKTEIGYRPLTVTEGNLKSTLKRIAESKSNEERDRNMEALQHILTAASIANDECDFGTGLELGLDLFSYGHEVFHPMVLHLLTTAYSLLNRDPFADIVKAHLSKRRHIP